MKSNISKKMVDTQIILFSKDDSHKLINTYNYNCFDQKFLIEYNNKIKLVVKLYD